VGLRCSSFRDASRAVVRLGEKEKDLLLKKPYNTALLQDCR